MSYYEDLHFEAVKVPSRDALVSLGDRVSFTQMVELFEVDPRHKFESEFMTADFEVAGHAFKLIWGPVPATHVLSGHVLA